MDKIMKLKLDLKTIKEKNRKEEQKKDLHHSELTFTPRSFTQNYRYQRNVKNIFEHLNNQQTKSWKTYINNTNYDRELEKKYNELERILTMNRKWKI